MEVGQAVDLLADDCLVAFPTETVWGLAARADSASAMERLRAFKGRDADKPVAVLVDGPDRLAELGVRLAPAAKRLAERFWPGPLTLVARCSEGRFAPGVAAPDGSIGLRCSSHPLAASLAAGALDRGLGPVTATSLNASGEPPARNAEEAARVASRDPSVVLIAGEAGGGAASSVVDATGGPIAVLREGAICEASILAAASPEAAASRAADPQTLDSSAAGARATQSRAAKPQAAKPQAANPQALVDPENPHR